jgi:PAS domain S-box-containing protein
MKHIHLSSALRITLLYTVLSIVWILFSDRLLNILVRDAIWNQVLATMKGWAFVFVSAVILYMVLNRALRDRERFTLELESHARQQEAVSALRQRALARVETPMLLDEAAMLVAMTLDAEYSSVLELDPDDTTLSLRAGVGWPSDMIGTAQVEAGSHTLVAAVLQAKEPTVIEDVCATTAPEPPPFFVDHGVTSSMCMVIVGRTHPFGLIGVHTESPRTFTNDERRFLQSIANVLATSIREARAEAELRFQKTLLETQSEASPDGILVVGTARNILSFNQRFTEIWGFHDYAMGTLSADVILEQALETVADPDTFRADIHYLYQHLEVQSRAAVALKDGRILDRYTRPIKDTTGTCYGRVWYYRDVTDFRQAEAAIRRSEENFRSLAETTSAITMIFRENQVLYVNHTAEMITGYSREELLCQHPASLVDTEYRDAIDSHAASLLKHEHQRFSYEAPIVTRSGEPRWLEITASSIEFAGHSAGLITGFDITARKQAEEQIRRRNQYLAALNLVTEAVSQSLDLPDLLETLKVLLTEHLHIAAGLIFLYHEEDDYLSLGAWWGVSATSIEENQRQSVATAHNMRVIREQAPILLHNLSSDETARLHHMLNGFANPWQFYLGVPLLAHGEIQGALDLFYTTDAMVQGDQIDFFTSLGYQVGVAIQNARLFQQVLSGHERLQTLSRRLVEVQEHERRYIARELHDEIGQILTGLNLSLEVITRLPPDQVPGKLHQAQTLVNDLMLRVREMSLELRPPMLDDLGLLPALLWYFERYTAQTGVEVTFKHIGIERRFAPEIEIAVYRMAQEALTNVARYANVAEVVVRLWANESALGIQVEDQGAGFDPVVALASHTSSGLSGMRERTSLLGGELSIESVPGHGSCLAVEFPLNWE